MIVLDTHMWIWFYTGDSRLSANVATRVNRQSQLSAVSLWELMILIQKGRIKSVFSAKDTVQKWLDLAPMVVVPVDAEIAILSRTLEFSHDDLADRFIAATAYRAGTLLATVDSRLEELSWLQTIS